MQRKIQLLIIILYGSPCIPWYIKIFKISKVVVKIHLHHGENVGRVVTLTVDITKKQNRFYKQLFESCNIILIHIQGVPKKCPGHIWYFNDNLIYAHLHRLPHVNLEPIKKCSKPTLIRGGSKFPVRRIQ